MSLEYPMCLRATASLLLAAVSSGLIWSCRAPEIRAPSDGAVHRIAVGKDTFKASLASWLKQVSRYGFPDMVEVMFDDTFPEEDLDYIIRYMAAKSYEGYGGQPVGYLNVLHFLRKPVQIADFGGGSLASRKAAMVLWKAYIPFGWGLNMGLDLFVPSRRVEQALQELRRYEELRENLRTHPVFLRTRKRAQVNEGLGPWLRR